MLHEGLHSAISASVEEELQEPLVKKVLGCCGLNGQIGNACKNLELRFASKDTSLTEIILADKKGQKHARDFTKDIQISPGAHPSEMIPSDDRASSTAYFALHNTADARLLAQANELLDYIVPSAEASPLSVTDSVGPNDPGGDARAGVRRGRGSRADVGSRSHASAADPSIALRAPAAIGALPETTGYDPPPPPEFSMFSLSTSPTAASGALPLPGPSIPIVTGRTNDSTRLSQSPQNRPEPFQKSRASLPQGSARSGAAAEIGSDATSPGGGQGQKPNSASQTPSLSRSFVATLNGTNGAALKSPAFRRDLTKHDVRVIDDGENVYGSKAPSAEEIVYDAKAGSFFLKARAR